jgi:hypothetical protein
MVVQATLATRTPHVENGGWAVGSLDSFQLSGHLVQCFVPGYTLEITLASATDSSHGEVEAIWGVHPLPISPSPETGSILRFITVICLDPGDESVLYVEFVYANATAVMAAARGNGFYLV